MLRLDSIHLSYAEKKILDGASISVECGSIVGLFGRNGCGKSSLLNVGGGLLSPNQGEMTIDGEAYHWKNWTTRYEKIAFLPSRSFLPPDMLIGTVINEYRKRGCVIDSSEYDGFKTRNCSELSGGERRLLEILLILGLPRRYYLLDEVFAELEPYLIEEVSDDLAKQARKGAGIIVVDHQHYYLRSIIHEGYLMKDGICTRMDSLESFEKQLLVGGYLNKSEKTGQGGNRSLQPLRTKD